MKDKIKKIFTIVLIIFAVLFGFSWVKSCNNAKDIKTYENVAQMRQKEQMKKKTIKTILFLIVILLIK